jgi:GntR family transcriptional repressor for pyruvate dehydrogenase complex
MRTLELQELVVSKPGAGTFVRAEASEPVSDALVAYLSEGKDVLLDVFEMRHILEPQIAVLAAERATPEDIQRMEEMLAAQADQIAQGETGAEGDTAFHFTIAEATHNSALVKVVTAVADILGQSREQPLQAPGRPQRSLASHRYILDMIKEGDGQGAREAMEHHISVVEPFHIPAAGL